MRKYSSNLAFVDLLFNLLVGFTSLFVIAFLMINPVSKDGEVTPPVKAFIEIEWDPNSSTDIDLMAQGPGGRLVYYANRENGYITLSRDDLGSTNDTYDLNGEEITVRRNYEVINFTDLPPGEYTISVFYFSGKGDPHDINFSIRTVSPHRIIHEGVIQGLTPRSERTIISFVVDHTGVIADVNSDIQIPIAKEGRSGP